MTACEEYISYLQTTLPDVVSVQELVDCGFYKSPQSAFNARKLGRSPDFFKLPNRAIMYPKSGIIAFLKKYKHETLVQDSHIEDQVCYGIQLEA